MRLTALARSVLAVAAVLVVVSGADAAPIGSFTFDYTNDFLLGVSQTFTVTNDSGLFGLTGDFTDIVINLTGTDAGANGFSATLDYATTGGVNGFQIASAGDPLATMAYNDIGGTGGALDLSTISLETAVLSLVFNAAAGVPAGTVQIGSFSAADFSNLVDGTEIVKSIEYVPTSVPEPATLLLLACGMAAGAAGKYVRVRARRQ